MEKLTFINSKGQSVVIGDTAPFVLTKVEGIGAVNVNIQTQKSPRQDGVSYIDNNLEPRSISMEIVVLGEDEEDILNKRHILLKAFNPKLGEGRLIYERGNIKREIKALSEVAPMFPDSGAFKDTMQDGLIQLYCANPFFLDNFDTSEEIITWIGGMRFPLRLPTTFAMAGAKEINIINDGDVETPIKIEITGTATKPKILNRLTGEFIKVNRVLTIDDTLVITTEFGNKRVELNGENVFHYMDIGSKFFNLDVGDNVVELITEDENDNANVKITYRNRYLGV